MPDAENLDNDAFNMQLFSFTKSKKPQIINFSNENKLGEGGFGILYKVKVWYSIYFPTMLQKSRTRI